MKKRSPDVCFCWMCMIHFAEVAKSGMRPYRGADSIDKTGPERRWSILRMPRRGFCIAAIRTSRSIFDGQMVAERTKQSAVERKSCSGELRHPLVQCVGESGYSRRHGKIGKMIDGVHAEGTAAGAADGASRIPHDA